MKDFPFWRDTISNAKTALILKGIEKDIAKFQIEPLFDTKEPKMTRAQMKIIRYLSAKKMAELRSSQGLLPK